MSNILICYSTSGHIFSVCLPIAQATHNPADTALLGAACIDMPLSDITNEFEYLQRSSNAYVFIIDCDGRTILHPMLPSPGLDYRSDPLFVDIRNFEPEAHMEGILDMMKQWVYFPLNLSFLISVILPCESLFTRVIDQMTAYANSPL